MAKTLKVTYTNKLGKEERVHTKYGIVDSLFDALGLTVLSIEDESGEIMIANRCSCGTDHPVLSTNKVCRSLQCLNCGKKVIVYGEKHIDLLKFWNDYQEK